MTAVVLNDVNVVRVWEDWLTCLHRDLLGFTAKAIMVHINPIIECDL